jgi:hypothetical protein
MTYQPQQPPTQTGFMSQPPQSDWAPPKPKSKAVPVLAGLVVVLAVAVAGLTIALLRTGDSGTPTAQAGAGGAFSQARDACKVVAGYTIEDAGKTLVVTVGSAFMNTDTAACVFDKLGVPDAVRQHVSTTRALDGQQTDSWPGYTARWTYHPDDGLQMTIRAA